MTYLITTASDLSNSNLKQICGELIFQTSNQIKETFVKFHILFWKKKIIYLDGHIVSLQLKCFYVFDIFAFSIEKILIVFFDIVGITEQQMWYELVVQLFHETLQYISLLESSLWYNYAM